MATATAKAELALKSLIDVGLAKFDTEKVADSLKMITENRIDLEKAEGEKLGSIQMNFRMQQQEAIDCI